MYAGQTILELCSPAAWLPPLPGPSFQPSSAGRSLQLWPEPMPCPQLIAAHAEAHMQQQLGYEQQWQLPADAAETHTQPVAWQLQPVGWNEHILRARK
jgi:hypothetical protein